jgi:4'-phosphopantetheinyl transferase
MPQVRFTDAGWDDLGRTTLRPESIQLYATRLPAGAPAADAIALLSAAERERAGRLVAPAHRGAFIAGRAFLRRVLACHARVAPGEIVFETGASGKPRLGAGQASGAIAFSFSRTRGLALVGVTAGAPFGVDVEEVRAFDDFLAVARRFFAPGEHRALCRLPPPARLRGFFECWTRKEAVVKALGVGLSVPLDRFEVTFGPGVAPEIARIDLDAPPPSAWSLVHLEPLEGVIGAVAAPFEVRSVEAVMLS